MKVAVLGASLSAQTVDHKSGDITGYCEVLRRDHLEQLGITELRQFTYPGNRLSDAGYILLQKVLEWRPEFCLIEPLVEDFSRGKNASAEEIVYFYAKLLANGIMPITLFCPHPSTGDSTPWPARRDFFSFLITYDLPIVDLIMPPAAEAPELFRGVHTTPAGARELARLIAAEFTNVLGRCDKHSKKIATPDITVMHFPAPQPEKLLRLELEVQINEDVSWLKLLQLQQVGPHSPVVEISINECTKTTSTSASYSLSIWDPYCYYARESYVPLCDLKELRAGVWKLIVSVSPTPPNRDKCRRKDIEWPHDNTLCMRPRGDLHLVLSNGTAALTVSSAT